MKKNTFYDINEFKKKLLEYQSKQSATLEIITPAVALRYLSSNFEDKENRIKNRELDDKTITKYMNDMFNRRWEVAEPILFDENGKLIDGQGRCTAVVKTGIPIICWVIRGLSLKAFAVIDSGKKRTLKDGLSMLIVDGVRLTRPSTVGAAINYLYNSENNVKHVDKDRLLTVTEIIDMVRNDFNFYEELFKGKNKAKIIVWEKRIKYSISISYLAAFYYKHKKADGNAIENFLNILTSNEDSTPIIVRKFRDNILENKNRNVFDKKYLNGSDIMKRIEALYSYYQQGVLSRKKEFTKKDLE